MTVGVEVGGERSKRLNGGDRTGPDIFAVEKLLEALEDALIGGLRKNGKQGPFAFLKTPKHLEGRGYRRKQAGRRIEPKAPCSSKTTNLAGKRPFYCSSAG